MGIRKSKITPSINVDDMLKKAEISHETETEKLDADKRLKEICEIKEILLKIQQDLQNAIKAEGNASVVLKKVISNSNNIVNGICNAIVKAEQNTEFRATIKSGHYKIFCENGNTGFKFEFRIFYFIDLQNEEDYERKESRSA